ncbi:PQQ-binding-like beta-propeller repeat protein [Falsirhodobacter halotolerans]|uniref:outer membrane protein assembly factor BamB family protein n=1 Tax=Falsirhodobacter halotolerans TaxID=1146892 RepID=UPI001FD60668|nr:PQQ-binding-like beta-propeller repeat protein [Falsirhodobacter halotolerans]MCJ8139655.1 PQQ-binding-like beta-propeller repeat protein [Falsirhodobacter halotolerans]
MKATTGFVAMATLALMACQREETLPGQRFDVRAPLEASVPTASNPTPVDTTGRTLNRAAPIALPAAQSTNWTHRGGNAQHLSGHVALSAQPSRIWSVDIGAGNGKRQRISAAPVAADGRVFAMDAGGMLTAVSSGGQKLWTTSLRPAGERSQISGGGLAIGGGRVFATTGYGELIALDVTSGAVIWRQRLGAPATGAPTYDSGKVYVVARDGTGWAVDAGNGRVDWTLMGTSEVAGMLGTASPAVAGSNIIFPFSTGEVQTVLRQSGARLWNSAVAGQRRGRSYALIPDITADPVVSGNTVYIGNQAGSTVALDRGTGNRLWAAKEGAYGPVAVGGNSVFLISDEAHLVRLDARTGETIWSQPMPYYTADRIKRRNAITPHYGPVIAGGRIVVASGDGQLRFFSPTDGALVGSLAIPDGAAAQPAVAGGVLYVVGADGQLNAFR